MPLGAPCQTVPKSGCSGRSLPMPAIRLAELGSTGAFETSWFQGLSSGNRRLPMAARAMQGVHTLIHLAATPDDDDFLNCIVPNNIIGVHHVLEAAQQAGLKRMILASSGQVVWYDRMRTGKPLGVDAQPTPRYWYAA